MLSAVLLVLCLFAAIFVCNGKAPRDAVLVFEKEEGGYFCLKIPYLYRTNKGTLIAMSEARGKDGRNSCDDFSGTDLVFKRSFDNGHTWSAMGTVWSNSTAEETNVVGNAGIVQDAATGRIWMPMCRNNEEVHISYSDDDGATWSDPVYHPELVLDDWEWVGLGPPSGLQLSTGRMLIPSYHTSLFKGDGEISKGHTVYSDDSGATWQIGSAEFGSPYLSNECQAVELQNGSILVNARTVTMHRIQILSHDGGLTFDAPTRMPTLVEPIEGCEGSIVRDAASNMLYYSGAYNAGLFRLNMTVLQSPDEGLTWTPYRTIDRGAVSYSALTVIPAAPGSGGKSLLGLLYERSDNVSIVFAPDQILFVPIALD